MHDAADRFVCVCVWCGCDGDGIFGFSLISTAFWLLDLDLFSSSQPWNRGFSLLSFDCRGSGIVRLWRPSFFPGSRSACKGLIIAVHIFNLSHMQEGQ